MERATRLMLAAAAACAAAFCAVLGLAYSGGPAQRVDATALGGFTALDTPRIDGLANSFAHTFDPMPYALLCGAVLAIGLATRGLRHAAAAAVLLLGANVSSQVLKPLLAHPRDLSHLAHVGQIHPNAFPSGHATASMALALAAVIVAPRAYRPLVAAIGGAVVLALAITLLILNWHFPSDVVGGELLATTWCLVVLAALRIAAARWPERGSMRQAARGAVSAPNWAAVGAVVLAAIVFVAVVLLARADAVVNYAQQHTSAVAVGAAIAACGSALLATVTALAARRG